MLLLLIFGLEMERRGTACRARRFWANNGIGHAKACPYALARDYETNLTHRKPFAEQRLALRVLARHRQPKEPLWRLL